MQFRPCFDESLLSSRQRACDHLYWIYAEHSNFILTVCMKVCNIVLRTSLREHADNDAKESAELWHLQKQRLYMPLKQIRRHIPPYIDLVLIQQIQIRIPLLRRDLEPDVQ